MSQRNGDLLARVVQLISEVQRTNKRLDGYILKSEARAREWEAWRKETDVWRRDCDLWRRDCDLWRRETTADMKVVAATLHSAASAFEKLNRRTALEKRSHGQ